MPAAERILLILAGGGVFAFSCELLHVLNSGTCCSFADLLECSPFSAILAAPFWVLSVVRWRKPDSRSLLVSRFVITLGLLGLISEFGRLFEIDFNPSATFAADILATKYVTSMLYLSIYVAAAVEGFLVVRTVVVNRGPHDAAKTTGV
jgi:hypothetical protein